ncbi:MAG: peptidoglycan DD-metalloendopeptidase family protein [Bacteroidaceae bacterium]|nr:peptidoglycan DD-metalloendopeptidase family protein [Bacteroidaceae bacterium]
MVARRLLNSNKEQVKGIIGKIGIAVLLVAAAGSARAQDVMPESVRLHAPMEFVDTLGSHDMLLNEANIIPSDEMYPDWRNNGVHYNSAMPDSFRIDLRHYAMPTSNTKVTDVFGYRPRRKRVHQGLDIKVQIGDTIYAAFDGKVRITAFQRRGYGHYVVIRHNNGIETLYAHLSKKLVKENQNVKSGDPIGLGGNTGRSSGSHLHFETILMGKSIDPAAMFDFKNQKVTGENYIYRKPGSKYVENGKVKTAGPEPKYHKVKSGDTIERIARKYGVPQKQIFDLNGLNSRSVIRPGQTLRYQ